MLSKEKATKAFLKNIENNKQFEKSLEIIKENSKGKIWLIGGFVYRNIADYLYNSGEPEVDLDYIIEKEPEEYSLPKKWETDKNRFGNKKFVNKKSGEEIDYVPLENIYSIKHRNLKPTIENYLTGVPLNIQAIAYDVYNKEIVGEEGIKALDEKIVKSINDPHFSEYYAMKKGKSSINEIIKEKAEEMDFDYEFKY